MKATNFLSFRCTTPGLPHGDLTEYITPACMTDSTLASCVVSTCWFKRYNCTYSLFFFFFPFLPPTHLSLALCLHSPLSLTFPSLLSFSFSPSSLSTLCYLSLFLSFFPFNISFHFPNKTPYVSLTTWCHYSSFAMVRSKQGLYCAAP